MKWFAATLIVMFISATTASAFYWRDWPGSGVTQVTTKTTTSTKSTTPTTGTNPTPSDAPEPTTMILAGIGLVATMGTRTWMKQRKQ